MMTKKLVKETFLCLGVIICAGLVFSCDDVVMSLDNVDIRGTDYVGSNPLLSDSTLLAGWYMAEFDNFVYVMPDGAVPQFAHCGTYNPIYIQDPLPESMTEGMEYTVNACLVDFDDNCKISYSIRVRQCGVQYHYYLIPTDGTSAYCFDATDIPVIAPAPDYMIPGPILVSTALMYIDEPVLFRPELNFKCAFDADQQFLYEITWMVENVEIFTSDRITLDEIDSTNLNETLLLSHGYSLGINIRCDVRISSTDTGNQTDTQSSELFFVGINVSPTVLTLGSADSAMVQFTPTVPLGCIHVKALPDWIESPCTVSVRMFDPNDEYNCDRPGLATVNLNNQRLCGTSIQGWRHTENRECLNSHSPSCVSLNIPSTSMTVTATNDRLEYPHDQIFYVQTQTSDNSPHDIWVPTRLSDIQVNYVGGSANTMWMGKVCQSKNDPRMITFDRDYWSLMEDGDFIMYRNTETDDTVQMKTWRCSISSSDYDLYCTCAVAVRSKGDVFIVNVCSSTRAVLFSHCENEVLDVRAISSTEYDVYFPTGTRVRVQIRTWGRTFLNVYIYPTAVDVNTVEGLCGDLNGVRDNPTSSGYVNRWRISNARDNMLSTSYTPPPSTEQIQVCLCPDAIRGQRALTEEAVCFTETYATCDVPTVEGTQKSCQVRSKRSVHRHRQNTHRILQIISDSPLQPAVRQRRSTPVTEADAYQMCVDYFSSKPIYQLANEIPSVYVENDILACMKDVALDDGDTFWTEAHFSTWSSSVVNEIGRNGTFVEDKQDVVTSFRNATCPSDCNGNGHCMNGTCICDADFVGDSCFLQKTAPLEITYIEGEGMCDISLGLDCHQCLHVFSTGLLEEFKCNIKTHQVSINGTSSLQQDTTQPGEYESMFDGFCCPNTMEGRMARDVTRDGVTRGVHEEFIVRYEISISNVADHYGDSRDVYVYDSTCQQYTVLPNGQLVFSLKENTCYIEGECYMYGENRNNGTCEVCYPPDSVTQWTYNCNVPSVPPSTPQPTETPVTPVTTGFNVLYIVLIVAAGCFIIGIIVVALIMVVRCNKTNRNVGSSQDNLKTTVQYGPGNNHYGNGGPSVISHQYPVYKQ